MKTYCDQINIDITAQTVTECL